jgi:hypothetical protein
MSFEVSTFTSSGLKKPSILLQTERHPLMASTKAEE